MTLEELIAKRKELLAQVADADAEMFAKIQEEIKRLIIKSKKPKNKKKTKERQQRLTQKKEQHAKPIQVLTAQKTM